MRACTGDERLLRLADKLQGRGAYWPHGEIGHGKFSSEQWTYFMWDLPPSKVALKAYPDGVAACAVCWAAIDPWFTRRGLKAVVLKHGQGPLPVYKDKSGWEAVDAFFALQPWQTLHLFGRKIYIHENTARFTGQRIREMVGKGAIRP